MIWGNLKILFWLLIISHEREINSNVHRQYKYQKPAADDDATAASKKTVLCETVSHSHYVAIVSWGPSVEYCSIKQDYKFSLRLTGVIKEASRTHSSSLLVWPQTPRLMLFKGLSQDPPQSLLNGDCHVLTSQTLTDFQIWQWHLASWLPFIRLFSGPL